MNKKSLFLLCFVFTFSISISVWFALETIKRESLNSIKNSLQTVTKISHEALHIWISLRNKHLIEVAKDVKVVSLAKQLLTIHNKGLDPHSSQELQLLRQIMRSEMNIHKDFGFFIISPDNMNIASNRDDNIGKANIIYKKRSTFLSRVFSGETLLIPPILSDTSLLTPDGEYVNKVPTTFMGSPIKDENGEVIAVLALRIDPNSDFTRLTKLGRLGDTGETYVFDEHGFLMTASRFDHHLQKIGLVSLSGQGMLSIRITDPGGNMLQGYMPKLGVNDLPLTYMAKSAISGKSGTNIEGYRDYRGVTVFGSWIWDEDVGFGLTTEIDMEEALIPYYQTRQVVLLLLIILLFFIGIFLWFYMDIQNKLSKKLADEKLELQVAQSTKELHELSYKDGLTGVANRRMFDQTLKKEWQRGQREKQPLSLLMIDIDFFKYYNDFYGHQQGDECLIKVANILTSQICRSTDLLARYGGEEFVILLPNTKIEQAVRIAKSLCLNVIEANISHKKAAEIGLSQLSISIGVSSLIPSIYLNSTQLVKEADKKLYLAKSKGRNCVES